MQAKVIERIPLVCPACRRIGQGDNGLHLTVASEEKGHVMEGFLTCADSRCKRRYPILEGVPVVVADLARWRRSYGGGIAQTTGRTGPMQKFWAGIETERLSGHEGRARLATYIDSHYGDFGDFDETTGRCEADNFWKPLSAAAAREDGRRWKAAIDLGCGPGRLTFEMAAFSRLAVGVDLDFAVLAFAVRLQREGVAACERRISSRCFSEGTVRFAGAANAAFVAADAMDPPFSPGSFETVAGVNLLDNVSVPLTLLGQMDALLAVGGRLLVASPYEWREGICEPGQWLENDRIGPQQMLRDILEGRRLKRTGFCFRICREIQRLPWRLHHHPRHFSRFAVHLLAADKRAEPQRQERHDGPRGAA